MRGISRVDSGSTRGFLVRAYRNGKVYSKLFSDRKNGGKRKAKKLAIIYRDELKEHVAQIPRQRKARVVLVDSRNNTGELGVSRSVKHGPNGRNYEVFSVSWRPETGVQKCTSFSISKYGEEKAFKLAVEHRRKMMREIHGEDFYRKQEIERRKRARQQAQ